MKKATIADRKPVATHLEAGQHHWCACGRSEVQPLCDGAHRGTGISPLAFQMDAEGDTHMCLCKQTKNPPYCDGSHAGLPEGVTEMELPQQEKGGAPVAVNTPEEPKVAMSRGAQLAGTGICSGEGGMLPDEQAENSRYFYELASAKFGYTDALLSQVQAFHFKAGQGAKTGTGGHLPGNKVVGKIADVRGLAAGSAAISPPTFSDS